MSPLTSSFGRLFDAVSCITGIRHFTAYEGQAAFMLEMAAYNYGRGEKLPYLIKEAVPDNFPGFPVTGGYLKKVDLSGYKINLSRKYIY